MKEMGCKNPKTEKNILSEIQKLQKGIKFGGYKENYNVSLSRKYRNCFQR